MSKFVHLHTHSHYSLLDGLPKIDELVKKTKELGMDAVALTDHGNLYGAIEFYKKARIAGVKPIIGVEAYLAPKSLENKNKGIDEKYSHLILLVKNNTGWKNLIKLVTRSYLKGFYYKPRIDKNLLREYSKGLIALSGCVSGEIPKLILRGDYEGAKKTAEYFRDIFGADNFFLEIGHHPGIPETIKANQGLKKLSGELKIPLVATQDIHYLTKEDAKYQDILLAVQTGNNVGDADRLTLKNDDFSMRTPEEMHKLFKDFPDAAQNTVKIADRCKIEIELGKIKLPKFRVPEKETANNYLKKLIDKRVKARYPNYSANITERIAMELGVIEKMGFADYFLIVQDFVNWAKERGIVVGPGRGSAAGSIISYILGITDIDPIKYNLIFERFLNPERIQMPDIDIDVTDVRRDEVLGYLQEKYGEQNVAHIITFGTMAARAAVRDVGRALGMSYGFCDQIAKLIPFNLKLKRAIENITELAEMYKNKADAKKLLDSALHLEGVARHASVHACGIVITKEFLTEYLPLQRSPQDPNVIVSQFEMHAVEDLGLLKIDLLGLRNLTIIENTIRLVNELRGEKIDISNLPLDDEKTFKLLQNGNTTGVFQLECLAGETIVSNTTIKKLYEKKHKKVLNSVYLDGGKIHKNRIINVLKSGVKDIYTLVAENGWYIKSTKDHSFLTENGWKKLKNIKPGEKILIKTKARHLAYNECNTCGKQINGQKDGQAIFCYKCSATFYRNPSKAISKEKIRQSRIKFYQQGGKPWNIGITAETSEKWKETAAKISKALMGVSLEERWGKEKAQAIKAKLSKRFSGKNNPMFGKPVPHSRRSYAGIREDLGHYVRSNWEADFARILKLHNTEYEYEPKTFPLVRENGEIVNYTPDFFVRSTNTFYEIKGWMHDLDEEKIKLFQRQYPEYNFVLINKTKFAEFALKYKKLIKWECPRIPIEQSFQFLKVKGIKYAGREETYDITMAAPGNNFVANGFVVHNSSGITRYLKDLKPTEFNDIVIPPRTDGTYSGVYRQKARQKTNNLPSSQT